MPSKPIYAHDCTGCTFLGTYEWDGQSYDLYTCKQSCNWPTVLARYSSDGPDYLSGLEIAKTIESHPTDDKDRTHPLVEAMKRAKERGHLTKKDTQSHDQGSRL